ncbi:hypothetical protein [Nonomuraea pusilla]|uniref:hypothetical protein n=1 Tax=Nonomuraea pusilla TaxID=46177 RepID=UPI001F2BC722|nr:hypothetical protein [Nonomuraea pusilla]
MADSPFVLLPRTVYPELHDQIANLCTAAGFMPRVASHAVEWQTVCALVETGSSSTSTRPAASSPPWNSTANAASA